MFMAMACKHVHSSSKLLWTSLWKQHDQLTTMIIKLTYGPAVSCSVSLCNMGIPDDDVD